MKEFRKLMDPLIQDGQNLNPADLISPLRGGLDYDRWVSDEDIPSPDDAKIRNINQLQLSTARYRNITSFLEYADSFEEVGPGEMGEDHIVFILNTSYCSPGMRFHEVSRK
jgi:DNA helicase II / ATP-dependent DNA helicase PcrA